MELGRYIPTHMQASKMLIIFLISLFLSGCTEPKASKTLPPSHDDSQEEQEQGKTGTADWVVPINVPEGEFFKVFGWLGDSDILYASNLAAGSNLYSYSLETGENKLILSSKAPIVTAAVNPDLSRILVHTSPSSFEAIVTVYDLGGNELVSQSFPSAELHAEWNMYDENVALIVAFNEDWTYNSFRMDTNDHIVEEIELPDPFAKWVGKESIAYLKWNQDSPALFAPLEIMESGGEITASMDEQIYHIETYKDLIVAVSRDAQDETKALYTFFSQQLKALGSFTVPHLTRFSDWLVPYQDYSLAAGRFMVFEPVRSGEADAYTEGFTLASYEIGGSREVLIEGLDNQPIVASPNGRAILYGYRYERIIDPESKKIINLIEEFNSN
ncbi:hypothetical protein [Bacillus sp. EB01]|uniref:YqgU-like beta propeller domain-containing protein n=1 Tax=Bacillus sp. EB01 TaxID=1347086 RepID=UPI0005C4DBF2|nr:hypothetical protein [Bacillus sp. EB01]